MEKTIFAQPRVLIGDYHPIDNFIKKINYNNYSCIDTQVPACRFRGTLVDTSEIKNNRLKIIAWQRNAFRVRKMDASQPTIVIMTLNREGIIEDVELSQMFSGGKGLLCSWKYLNRNLREKIIGLPMDLGFVHKIKLDRIQCFHIAEVVAGAYSYYHILNDKHNIWEAAESFFEEEVMDCYAEGNSVLISGLHVFQGKTLFQYTIIFHDILNKVGFKKQGNMYMDGEVKADFYRDNELIFSDILTQSETDFIYIKMQKFMLSCIGQIRGMMCDNNKIKILNTNLIPSSAVGILIEYITLRLFRNNFNYVMHVLTAIQRPNDIPGCIGAILDDKEASQYFPGFDFSELI